MRLTLWICVCLPSLIYAKELAPNLHNGKFFIYDRVDRDMVESSVDEITSYGPDAPPFLAKVKPPDSFKASTELPEITKPNSQVTSSETNPRLVQPAEAEKVDELASPAVVTKVDQQPTKPQAPAASNTASSPDKAEKPATFGFAEPIIEPAAFPNFDHVVKPPEFGPFDYVMKSTEYEPMAHLSVKPVLDKFDRTGLDYHHLRSTQNSHQNQMLRPIKKLKEGKRKSLYKPFERKVIKEELYPLAKFKPIFQIPKPLPMQMSPTNTFATPIHILAPKLDHSQFPSSNFYNPKQQLVQIYPLRSVDSSFYPFTGRDNYETLSPSEIYVAPMSTRMTLPEQSELSPSQRDTLLRILDTYYQLINRFNINFVKLIAESQDREMKLANSSMLMEPTLEATHAIPIIF